MQRHIRQFNYQRSEVCDENERVAIFGGQMIKGFIAKRVNEAGIKNCLSTLTETCVLGLQRTTLILDIAL